MEVEGVEEIVKGGGMEGVVENRGIVVDTKLIVRKRKYVSERASRTAAMFSKNQVIFYV